MCFCTSEWPTRYLKVMLIDMEVFGYHTYVEGKMCDKESYLRKQNRM